MRKIRRMVSVVMISCMMAGCLAGCGSWKETGGTHGERQGTESRSGTERESIAERYRQKAIKEEFEENIAETGQSQQNMAAGRCQIKEEACDSVVSAIHIMSSNSSFMAFCLYLSAMLSRPYLTGFPFPVVLHACLLFLSSFRSLQDSPPSCRRS